MESSYAYLQRLERETAEILSLIQKEGPLTKNDIAQRTDTRLTTLNRIMQPLEKKGIIVQSRIGESTGGRKPVLYDVNPDRYYIVGIDISRTYTRAVVTNLKMKVLEGYQFPMDHTCSPEKTIDLITEWILRAGRKLGRDSSGLIGIGVGTVGPLDRESGVMLNPVNFGTSGWENVSLKEMIRERLHCPVMIDNGANAAVLGERLFGKARGFMNSAYIHCGIGIRTGVISAGTIVRTLNDAEDAFGHMVVDADGEVCSCGNYGCIECYASAHSITRNFVAEVKKGRVTLIEKEIEDITYIDICTSVQKDPLAREVVTRAAVVLGIGLANFINLLNPGIVILSGPLVKCSSLFYDICTETALKKCYIKKEGAVVFSRGGALGEDAIAVGSAALLLENLLRSEASGNRFNFEGGAVI